MSDFSSDQSSATMNTSKGLCAALTSVQQQQALLYCSSGLALQHFVNPLNLLSSRTRRNRRKRRNITVNAVEAWCPECKIICLY